MFQASTWANIDVANLVVSALTPIAVVVFGFILNRTQAANRQVTKRLIQLHGKMAPLFNDLYCFFHWVGHFRDIEPPDLIEQKRKLDRLFHTNSHLFGKEFQKSYRRFMDLYFDQGTRVASNAAIVTSLERLREERGTGIPWNEDWNHYFASTTLVKDNFPRQESAYDKVMLALAKEAGVRRARAPRRSRKS